jgi:hypothetical protein
MRFGLLTHYATGGDRSHSDTGSDGTRVKKCKPAWVWPSYTL